jgi:hypothetical protein
LQTPVTVFATKSLAMTSSRVEHPFRSGSAELRLAPNADLEYVELDAGIGSTKPARFNRRRAVGAPRPRGR